MNTSLQQLYDSLEEVKSVDPWQINESLATIDLPEGDIHKLIALERRVIGFVLENGDLTYHMFNVTRDGNPIKHDFTDGELRYLKHRLDSTSNPWMIARYAHVIWQEERHNTFAERAIDGYLEAFGDSESRDIPKMISAILKISSKSRIRRNDAKNTALKLLREADILGKSAILQAIVDNGRFTRNELNQIADEIPGWDFSEILSSYFLVRNVLPVFITFLRKRGRKHENLYELLAVNEDLILDQHKDDTDFIRLVHLGVKAYYLQLAGLQREAEAVMREYNRLKETVHLKKFSHKLDDKTSQRLNDFLNRRSEELLSLPTNNLLAYFAFADDIIPNLKSYKQVHAMIHPLAYELYSTTIFDINSNFTSPTREEFSNISSWQMFGLDLVIHCYTLFMKVIVDGIYMGKVNYYHVINYLGSYTWYGLQIRKGMSPIDEEIVYNWISMITPGIHSLFTQFEHAILLQTDQVYNHILAIDTLTLKVEGIVRDYISLSGGSTTRFKKNVPKEMLLEELLRHQVLERSFSQKDIELLKFVFTDKGWNLRNDIAHGFLPYFGYSIQRALMVFFCILRLSKYLPKTNRSEEE